LVCNADYHAPMSQSDRDAKLPLTLPEHILSIMDGWAAVELQATRRKCWKL
jgi:hypothetical protein